jgi:hypothetical protein
MKPVLCLSLLCAAATAAADPAADPEGAADGEAISGSVLVWHDATFSTEPTDTAATLKLGALAKPRKERVGRVLPMRVVSTKGAYVEVEPAAELDCTWSRLATTDDVIHLHLFVKRADLAPVLARPFTKTFPDGTKLALKPGVPVVPAADGWYALAVGGNELAAEIPAASVGHSYKLDKPKPAGALAGHEHLLAPHTTVKLGDRALALENLPAIGVEAKGDTTLFTIEARCATITVAAPSKAVHDSDDEDSSIGSGSGSGGAMGVLELRGEDYLPPATPLSVGTRQLAYAGKPIYLVAAPHGKTACFDRRVRIEAIGPADPADSLDDKLHLCAPASKVVHERMRSASSANGTTGR